jgi:hypothetical protein
MNNKKKRELSICDVAKTNGRQMHVFQRYCDKCGREVYLFVADKMYSEDTGKVKKYNIKFDCGSTSFLSSCWNMKHYHGYKLSVEYIEEIREKHKQGTVKIYLDGDFEYIVDLSNIKKIERQGKDGYFGLFEKEGCDSWHGASWYQIPDEIAKQISNETKIPITTCTGKVLYNPLSAQE